MWFLSKILKCPDSCHGIRNQKDSLPLTVQLTFLVIHLHSLVFGALYRNTFSPECKLRS